MLIQYALALWLVSNGVPGPCTAVCMCTFPLREAGTTPASLSRYARRTAYAVLLGTVTSEEVAARDSSWWPDSTSPTRRRLIYTTATRYTFAVKTYVARPSSVRGDGY
jgi:hypothetical protein